MLKELIFLLLLHSSVKSWNDHAEMNMSTNAIQSIEDYIKTKTYWYDRERLIETEEQDSIRGSVILTKSESLANAVLMKYKEAEWLEGFNNPGAYPANLHFFEAKPLIEKSTVFKILKQLPKGALLHIHDTGMVSYDFLFSITKRNDLYICMTEEDYQLRFFRIPDQTTCASKWQLLSVARENDPTIDEMLNHTLRLDGTDPHKYKDINDVWSKFANIFKLVDSFVTYRPVFEDYVYQSLQELYDDNVKYVEVRTTLPPLYDLDGKMYQNSGVIRSYKGVAERFKSGHPDFIGMKIIYAPPRHVTNETMKDYIKILHEIRKNYPEFVLGFDLVGQEDMGCALKGFVPDFLQILGKVPFFFHSGETNWYGSNTDENLVDAVLLGTKRIGHGYALLKHPELLKIVRNKQIAIEVAPISNQVLKLVEDIRNHPAAVLGALGFPIVITNDDPSYWGAKGVSYDWYMAFMGMASRTDDLRYLKQLAINSIIHCGLSQDGKKTFSAQWTRDWDVFIKKLATNNFSN